jgi:Mannosyltransferase (PIG-V)
MLHHALDDRAEIRERGVGFLEGKDSLHGLSMIPGAVGVGQRLRGDPAPLGIYLWSRAAIWIAAIFALFFFEPNRHPDADRWDTARMHDLGYLTDVWARWDSDFFLRIAENGYDDASAAFHPLYPALVALVGRAFFGHYVLAGVVVSLLAALGSFVLLYRLAVDRLGAEGARRTVLYLAVFPMTLFLQAVYSESLFLLCVLAAFALAERDRFAAAGLLTGLAILTRAAGLALLPALALLAWRHRDRLRALAGVALAIPVAAVYPLVLWQQVGDAWAFTEAQDRWQRSFSSAGPLGGLWEGLVAGWRGLEQFVVGHGTNVSGVGPMHAAAENLQALVFLLLFIVLATVAWKRFGAAYGLFAAVSLAIPLSYPSSRWPLLSMPRFGLVIFPLFLALAALAVGRPRLHTAVVACSALLLGVAVVQWALWQWVA